MSWPSCYMQMKLVGLLAKVSPILSTIEPTRDQSENGGLSSMWKRRSIAECCVALACRDALNCVTIKYNNKNSISVLLPRLAQLNHLSMAYFLRNICTKKYWNRTTIVEIVVGGWVASFFETLCVIFLNTFGKRCFLLFLLKSWLYFNKQSEQEKIAITLNHLT